MKPPTDRRRGVVLLLVVMLLGILAAVFGVLTHLSLADHRQRQRATLQRTARSAVDSVCLLVAATPEAFADAVQGPPVTADISQLLPPRATGTAEVTCTEDPTGLTCRIRAEIHGVRLSATAKRTLTLPLQQSNDL
jgi:type II secretory pathway pseudopilin PulG